MSTELKTVDQPKQTVAKTESWIRPHYDVSENDEGFNVRVSLPGVSKDGVDISLEDDILLVVGKRNESVPEGWRPLRRELSTSNFRLSLRLNVKVNEAKIKAHVENGILDLKLPKAEEIKPRKIKIS